MTKKLSIYKQNIIDFGNDALKLQRCDVLFLRRVLVIHPFYVTMCILRKSQVLLRVVVHTRVGVCCKT